MSIPERDGLPDGEIKRILSEYKRVAVVGMSRDPSKPAHYVPKFLKMHGYEIIPVNPVADEILGLKAYKSLGEVPEAFDVVDVFRPSEQVLPVAEDVLRLRVKPKVFWMQEGIYSKEAAELLRREGITVVWDRCMMREHNRLFGSKPYMSLSKL
ncbi:MAG TPA: CoA-binding protein [Candidatus Caldiarchaeum subterraneum]|uniref:CoA-binding protein n=1 Tax=Caldiarchaeum subterraneum TaxID=311458 RepID=A0A832ZW92_CALS0|nr:CoA-binding protein [Aigarchaeota archaeon]HIQ30042.1 CoA-binding protein [Candidatus Caldarchaeum subterraneum]